MNRLIGLLLFFVLPGMLVAQVALPLQKPEGAARVFGIAGLSFTTGAGGGYEQKFAKSLVPAMEMRWLAYGWHPVPPHHFPENAEAGAGLTLFPAGTRFRVPVRGVLEVRQANSQLSSGVAVASRISLLPTKHFETRSVGAEIGWHRTWATYFQHTARYRRQYAEAKNGWYKSTAGYMLVSAQVEQRFAKNRAVFMQAGYRLPDNFKMYGLFLIPWSAQAGFTFQVQ